MCIFTAVSPSLHAFFFCSCFLIIINNHSIFPCRSDVVQFAFLSEETNDTNDVEVKNLRGEKKKMDEHHHVEN